MAYFITLTIVTCIGGTLVPQARRSPIKLRLQEQCPLWLPSAIGPEAKS